jgi:uncharacterized RDD family membrane protein YckC
MSVNRGDGPPDDETRIDWQVAGREAPAENFPPVDELPDLPDVTGTPAAMPPVAEPPAPPQPSAPDAMPRATPPAPPPRAQWPPTPGSAPYPGTAPYPGGAWAGAGWAAPPPGGRFAVPGAPGLEFAGAGPRFVAYFVDGVLLAIVGGILIGVIAAVFPRLDDAPVASAVLLVAIDAAYFVGLWSSGDQATLGMRLLKLQVGNAFDGRRIDGSQALRRWLALGSWVSAIGFTPALQGSSSLMLLVWSLVLLVSTATSPTKQGLHDRIANTAVVRPVGAGSGGLVLACIVVVFVLALVAIVAIVALIFLGNQVSAILSTMGTSVAP